MLPTKTTIRKAIRAAEITLRCTQEGFKGYNDSEAAILDRIDALHYVLKTGKPYKPIVSQYANQTRSDND